MNSTDSTHPDRRAALRSFGFLMGGVLGVLGLLFWWKESILFLYLFLLSASFLLAAVLSPSSLSLVEKAWMTFGEYASRVVTFIILVVSFYLVITPVGLLFRFFRPDPLRLQFEKETDSYWDEIPEDSPGSRPYTPY